jgi:serine/threonine protein kinase
LEVDLEDRRSPLLKLPEADRHWLVDSGFRLIVPILARDGSLLGMVGLGEKKSGLPFMKEDLQLLHAIASSAAWVLELDLGRLQAPQPSWRPAEGDEEPDRARAQLASELAKECTKCGTVYMGYVVFCNNCSRKLEPAHAPYVLPGKFRFEKRIGVGGMGIVYRGADLALGRHVALKTLRRVSPEDALRLRREARAAAAVSHPHLAAVYGLETWQGTPFLVMELLEGGTLADRLDKGALPVGEVVELGIAMAAALAHLHAADILHRDIKPSNIGFSKDAVAKLMDFGIARMVLDLERGERSLPDTEGSLPTAGSTWQPTESVSRLVGTLGYLSPEALEGEPADPSFDLWSLGVVLLESLLGRKLFAGEPQQVMARIRSAKLPELTTGSPHDAALSELFHRLLHRSRARRPATAVELGKQLQALRSRLAPPSVPP